MLQLMVSTVDDLAQNPFGGKSGCDSQMKSIMKVFYANMLRNWR
jgi:hypothetical protein